MSVEPSEAMSHDWTMWQGHMVNGLYPLGRYLGCSDHSGVFLTKSERHRADVALKLIPAYSGLSELQLPRWKRVAELAQPRLLPLLDCGECQLEGMPYLYLVMEYADQTLAQVLHHRALTEGETREMLLPILEALIFLHGQDLVHGQLKPTNVLVVGDELKLASDTIRRVGEGTLKSNAAATLYDPADAPDADSVPADDIWALGVSLFEALTRGAALSLGENRRKVALPANFSAEFREVVARCMSTRSQDRPNATDLIAWAGGSPLATPAADIRPATLEPLKPTLSQDAAPLTVPSHNLSPLAPAAPFIVPARKPRALSVMVCAALVIFALAMIGIRVFKTQRMPVVAAKISDAATPAATEASAPTVSSTTSPSGNDVAAAPAALHEDIPEISHHALRAMRGHVTVPVQVTIDPDGSVSAAVADKTGASKYFRRLAVGAAKKWSFSTAATPAKRQMQILFDFSRDGTTAQASAGR